MTPETVTAPAPGLTTAQAAQRLALDGPNAVAPPPPRRLIGRITRQLTDPLVALLLVAAVVTFALDDLPGTFVILLVVTVNTTIGVIQEVRADRAIAALDQLAAPTARVVRDGADLLLPTADIVRDDLVRLEAGDIVPADLKLDDAYRVKVDEAALTPLQRRLSSLGRVLGLTALVLSALVFALGVLAGQPLVQMAITAVSLVVAAAPESLPAVVTLALALGARRMANSRTP